MSTIHVLDHKSDKIIGCLENSEGGSVFWNDEHEDTIKNEEFFKFIMQADAKEAEHFSKKNRVVIPADDGSFREFIISRTVTYQRQKEVYTAASYSELTHQKLFAPITREGDTVSTAAIWALNGTDWQPGIVEYSGIRKLVIEDYTNCLNALKIIASTFDLELRFRVLMNGNKIIGRFVDFLKKRGKFRGKEVVLGKNLIGVERREISENIVTALRCLGPEQEDGSRLVVIVEDAEALERWGRNGRHIWADYEPQSDNSDMTEDRIRQLGQAELQNRINTVVEYTAEEAALEHIFGYEHEKAIMGDTIRVKDEKFSPPLYLETRIIKTQRPVSSKRKKTYTFGDFIEYTKEDLEKKLKAVRALLAKKASVETVQTAKTEAISTAATDASQKASTAELNAKAYTDTKLVSYVSATTYNQEIGDLQNQIDGNITSWFYGNDPTMNNAPANSWLTTNEKNNHLGDLFYNTVSGYAWRFAVEAGVYKWISVKDTDVTKALQDAQNAQDTADAKRRVFVAQPVPPYDIGDLWTNGQRVYRATITKTSGQTYVAGDWQLVGDVTSQNTSADTSKVGGTPASEIETKTGAQTKVDNLIIGGENLLFNSTGRLQKADGNADGWTSGTKVDFTDNLISLLVETSMSGELTKPSTVFNVKPSTKYTVSFKVKGTANSKSFDIFFLGSRTQKNGINATYDIVHFLKSGIASTTFTEYVISFSTASDEICGFIRIDNNGSSDGLMSKVWFSEIKIEEGDKKTTWSPSVAETEAVAQAKANMAESNAKNFSKNASNLSEGIVNVSAVALQTAPNGARVRWDGVNGLVQYDAAGNVVTQLGTDGSASFAGNITGASGTFSGDISTGKDIKVGNKVFLGETPTATPSQILYKGLEFFGNEGPMGGASFLASTGGTLGDFISGSFNGFDEIIMDFILSVRRLRITEEIEQQSVIAPSFLNGWLNYGSGYQNVGFYKGKDGRVYLQGTAKSGSMGYAMFQLPSTGGYRPSSRRYMRGNGPSGLIRIDVDANGYVFVMPDYVATNALVSLEGISFRP